MRPLAILAAAVAAAIAVPSAAHAQDDLTHQLEHIERALWHGWATHDTDAFDRHLIENAVQVGPWGIATGKEAIKQLVSEHGCTLEDVQFSDWAAHEISDDATILTYAAMQKGSCDGEALPARILASAVYVRHKDHWMSASYHETPVDE